MFTYQIICAAINSKGVVTMKRNVEILPSVQNVHLKQQNMTLQIALVLFCVSIAKELILHFQENVPSGKKEKDFYKSTYKNISFSGARKLVESQINVTTTYSAIVQTNYIKANKRD